MDKDQFVNKVMDIFKISKIDLMTRTDLETLFFTVEKESEDKLMEEDY